ncbi:phage terminase large subunit [Clostridium sp. JS66]|uniref:phage terminase large subunit n=1 Tax=Clostridium sp. JS66 TaxID=3064705 RepID=UPI00298DB6C3|nr:phage terminase large subunit [Clostridium sp. JS66]WPC42948.1 phage terminase large subunit [Clostridium sp. JS66]
MNDTEYKKRKLELEKQLAIIKSRESFWYYCKVREPDFYKDSRIYLHNFCELLQQLYERKLINSDTNKPFKRLIINMPPRHGKSRTLGNFCSWILGKNKMNSIMTVSYNCNIATDFSRNTRDIILGNNDNYIGYSDIFPDTKIKQGNGSMNDWALEGTHHTYTGTGWDGSATGKGCTVLIVDDQIKTVDEALNEAYLDKLYNKYNGTFISRMEHDALQIICMTRWSEFDLCGRVLNEDDGNDWYVLKLPVIDESNNTMLCDEIMDIEEYKYKKKHIQEEIFLPNYMQIPINKKGALYSDFKEYETLPFDVNGESLLQDILCYVDTADTGADYLASVVGGVYNGELYILDIIYTQEPMEVTEGLVAGSLFNNHVRHCWIESNNGGRGFARNVEDKLWKEYYTRECVITKLPQTKNKITRIIMNSTFVQEHVYFPINSKIRWSKAWEHLINFQRMGKNKHDDIEDAITGLCEKFIEKYRLYNSAGVQYDDAIYKKGMGLKNKIYRKGGTVF